jgi:UDP-N-acetylglucosamine:LPS N-acetylglucosamine transferase
MATETGGSLESLRIGLVASAGGHLNELLKATQTCINGNTFAVTTSEAVSGALQKVGKVYAVGECNRQHPFRVMVLLLRCVWIVLLRRPDVIISTGAAVGCVMCLLAKLTGARVVWLDSITNVEHLSLSGRLVRPFADLFLVQWPELVQEYRGVEYIGAVI